MAIFSEELLAFYKTQFTYEPETGIFRWLRNGVVGRTRFKVGDVARGSSGNRGQQILTTMGMNIQAHILAYWFMTGSDVPEGSLLDHKDRDPGRNAWSNLRLGDKQINAHNTDRRANNTTGVTGVYPGRRIGTWHARIKHGKMILLGTFDTFEDAVQARLQAEMKYIGEIVSLNVAHMYKPDVVPVGRKIGQWRKEDNVRTWSIVDGKRHWHRDDQA